MRVCFFSVCVSVSSRGIRSWVRPWLSSSQRWRLSDAVKQLWKFCYVMQSAAGMKLWDATSSWTKRSRCSSVNPNQCEHALGQPTRLGTLTSGQIEYDWSIMGLRTIWLFISRGYFKWLIFKLRFWTIIYEIIVFFPLGNKYYILTARSRFILNISGQELSAGTDMCPGNKVHNVPKAFKLIYELFSQKFVLKN